MSYGAGDFFLLPLLCQDSGRQNEGSFQARRPTAATCSLTYAHPELETNDLYLFLDEERRCVFPSDGLCRLLGFSRKELLGKRLDQLQPQELEFNEIGWREFLDTGRRDHLVVFRSKSGEVIGLQSLSRKLPDGCLVSIFSRVA